MFKKLEYDFDLKQKQLDDLREKASNDARKFAMELGKAQSESNVLLLELKKYEGLHKFMDLERDMILQAQQDAEGIDPAISTQNVAASETRRRQLEDEIEQM